MLQKKDYLMSNTKLELCGYKRRLKIRCFKDNNIMYNPVVFWGINKTTQEKDSFALGYRCDKCESKFIFMTLQHPNYGKGNEIQEFDRDGNITMYNRDGTLSKNQDKQFIDLC